MEKIKSKIVDLKIEGNFCLQQLKGLFMLKQINVKGLSSDSE